MTKNERIKRLENEVRKLASILGYALTKNIWGEVRPSGYSLTIHEIFRALFDELGIENIHLIIPEKRQAKIRYKQEEVKNATENKT